MFYNDNFRQDGNFGYGEGIDININNTNTNTNQNVNMNMNVNDNNDVNVMGENPIVEQGRERVCEILFTFNSEEFNKNYVLYSARLGAEGRINEMRKITADQFDTVGEMLDDLLINFESGAKPLASKSLALKNSLDDIGVHAFVNCYEDENMNMVINISVDAEYTPAENENY